MTIPPKYEDIVAELEASNKLCDSIERSMKNHRHELGLSNSREAALREELDRTKKSYEAYGIDFDRSEERAAALQQRLTVAEQRISELESLLSEIVGLDPRGEFLGWQLDGKIDAALKPAAEEGALGARPVGCCCPPIGHAGIWAAAICPVHFGLRRPKPSAEGEGS